MAHTIAAIATPFGSGAIGVVRISGDKALEIANQVFRTKKLDSFCAAEPNHMYFGVVDCGSFSDQCLAVYFKAPHSFTGEDVVEFQCHGGVRLIQELLQTIIDKGAAPADKGEFTKRAFLNSKYSLSEAEGIVDMINSENLAALNAGYRQLCGALSEKVGAVEQLILDATASLEASLDYPEELEEEVRDNLPDTLAAIKQALEQLQQLARRGKIVKSGINVAIIGEPNVGKSSLLNAILGRERAIVTDIAGTTRDTLQERVERNGIFINFIDTAGIRNTDDKVEQIGVDMALSAAQNADVIVFMQVASEKATQSSQNLIDKFNEKPIIKVYNKADLGVLAENDDGILIEAKTGVNVERVLDDICKIFSVGKLDSSGDVITNIRHIEAINTAYNYILNTCKGVDYTPTECVLVDLRAAYMEIGKISGSAASEDIIDKIFSKFCLGK